MADRQILFVLGMHRSGTSALCAALESCGASFGSNLLDSMPGVNERGFWEDAQVVEVNQRILARLHSTWFKPPASVSDTTWNSLSEEADSIRHFLSGLPDVAALHAIKDPRLCVTLPLWLHCCEELGLPTAVTVISRAPLEVANSLFKRDGFPLGYGLRLYARYNHLMQAQLPGDTVFLSYDALLQDPAAALHKLAERVPLNLDSSELAASVQSELRHFKPESGSSILSSPPTGPMDSSELMSAVERDYPLDATLAQLLEFYVQRGEKLTQVGESHSEALATVDRRDREIEQLSQLHTQALATIAERDEQITELDNRLAETGAHLEQALQTIEERDGQLREKVKELEDWEQNLQRVLETPILNRLFYRMWYREDS